MYKNDFLNLLYMIYVFYFRNIFDFLWLLLDNSVVYINVFIRFMYLDLKVDRFFNILNGLLDL